MEKTAALLRERGIRPTMQRLAVARRFLPRRDHPTAERLWEDLRREEPALSRATVYNTLELFARKGLALKRPLGACGAAYDPVTMPHHHLVDEETGHVYDIPWGEVKLPGSVKIKGFEVSEYHLVIRGRRKL